MSYLRMSNLVSAHLELGQGREIASNGSSSRGHKNSPEGGVFWIDCV